MKTRHANHGTRCLLELALAAFFHLEVRYHPSVVDKATQAESSAGFQPRRQHTGQRNQADEGGIQILVNLLTQQEDGQTTCGQEKTNVPSKALGFGGLPVRSRL